ncbi:MAG TPA: ABC transporter permease [Candidatus Hydrogenedentes bacterium]|nr:ABC transporter permease [Candidatus Hydrogenedentota bacterium]HPG68042.1 ABC transporter permease [Candidatus Hydrogenedentota bacterium]
MISEYSGRRPHHHAVSLTRIDRTIRLGLKSLWNHRLRSLLTALGIVFGVCSVIAMLAIGEGASYEAQEQIRRLGSNNIILRGIKPPEDKSSTSQQSRMAEYGLTYDDVRRIRETVPNVQVEVPGRIVRSDVWHGGSRIDCDVYGTVPWYPEVNNHPVAEGRFFTDIEFESKANVCTIDENMARQIFRIDSPVGGRVRVGTLYYRVIGVMAPKASHATTNAGKANNLDAPKGNAAPAACRMFIPLTTSKERFGEVVIEMQSGSRSFERVELHEVTVKVASLDSVVEVASIIDGLLDYHHKKQDYELVVPLELLQQAERTKQIFNIVLGGIAAISLLVGGIGIMNIMLASVTERTREIGIRRALGARRRDIVIQFLAETVILSGAGGVIGVALGIAIPFFITLFAQMATIVTPWSPIIAFSISGLVGVIFGIYPALRAANMDPVEALRHE